jgi:hypothetical protein
MLESAHKHKAVCRIWLAREQKVRAGSQDSYMPRGINYPLKDSVDNTTDVKVWWSAKQSSDTMPIEARRPDFHDTSNLIIFLRNDILIYSQETFNEGTQS